MIYTEKFKELVKYCSENGLYIGTGNPNAKIVIIGKECAIDTTSKKGEEQYKREIENNPSDWDTNLTNVDFSKYNPLYPYKGQLCKKRSETKKGIRGGGGTSATWYNYQKLFNQICPKHANTDTINFHEHCFITELNEVTAKTSGDVHKEEREKSIQGRKQLLKEKFFQEFPIVIVAAGHYPREFKINLVEMFKADFAENESVKKSNNLGKYWINIHRNEALPSPRLLIHTNQLSMPSNDLIVAIAKECKDFAKKFDIKLEL